MSKLRISFVGGLKAALMLIVATFATVAFDAVAVSGPAYAQTVSDIRVSGNRRVEPETVRTYLQFKVGDVYDAGLADASLRTLFSTGLFAVVHFNPSGFAIYLVIGLILGLVYVHSRSLVAPVAAHVVHNGAVLATALIASGQ